MTCSNIQMDAYGNARATTLLFCRRPPSGVSVRLLECSTSAATGQAADRDDGQAISTRGPVHPSVGADGASGGLTDDLAAGDDHRVAAGARTCDAHGAHNPRAIETVAAAATALFAMSGAVLPPRICCDVRESRSRAAFRANRTAISRHCRCCRRHCRIAPAECRLPRCAIRDRKSRRAALNPRLNVERLHGRSVCRSFQGA